MVEVQNWVVVLELLLVSAGDQTIICPARTVTIRFNDLLLKLAFIYWRTRYRYQMIFRLPLSVLSKRHQNTGMVAT